MGFHLLISTHFTRVDGTIRPYRDFSNHDDKVVTLGPREVEFGTSDGEIAVPSRYGTTSLTCHGRTQ